MDKTVPHESNIAKFPALLPGADHFIQIPDAEYVAGFLSSESFYFRGISPRLRAWFQILDEIDGERRICGIYTVAQLFKNGEKAPPGARNPEFKAGLKSKLIRDLAMLLGDEFNVWNPPTRLPVDLYHRPVRILTRTVRYDSDSMPRPEALTYSIIRAITGWGD